MGLLITLLLSAFFSGIEIAFYASNKLKIELGKTEGSLSGKYLGGFYENKAHFLTTLLVGNNIALVVFGSLMAKVLGPESLSFLGTAVATFFAQEPVLILYQTLAATAVIVIFGEFLPKVLFHIQPSRTLKFFAIPLRLIYVLLYPLTWTFEKLARLVIRVILRRDLPVEDTEFSAKDLELFIKSSTDEDEREEDEMNTDIFEKALYLRDVKVRECMVPRTEIEALEISATPEQLRRKFVETKHSRIILYDENIDDIKGYTHHFELLKNPRKLESVMYTIPVVPESMSARDLLSQFIRESRNIAWVVDEYGGTAGIVTLEDVMEEIFGEIRDEHDQEGYLEKRITENDYLLSGRLEIDYLNETYELAIPEGDYETLSGYIVAVLEDIPDQGEEIDIDGFKVRVLRSTEKLIELVRLKVVSSIK